MSPARRKWGQHWLASETLAVSLIDTIAPRQGDRFIEIGPGRGRLTIPLLRRPIQVVAVEIDPECAALLEDLGARNLTVVNADILAHPTLPWVTGSLRLVGNLPYNVSSPILRLTAHNHDRVIDAHYMLQEDVAERVAAPPGSRDYGLLSVLLQWHYECRVVQRLSPGAFRPPPRVRSAFVRLVRRDPVGGGPIDAHQRRVLESAFAHRRKTLSRALRYGGWDPAAIAEGLCLAQVEPRTRAEQLSPERFARLAAALPESDS